MSAHIARQPGVPGWRHVLGTYPLADREGRRGVHSAQRTAGGWRVLRPGGFRDRWFRNVLAAQLARAGVDRTRRQDRAIGKLQLRGVEPAAEVAVAEVGGSVQPLKCMPECVNVLPGDPDGEQRQREGPALPGLFKDRFIVSRRMSGAPSPGAPHIGNAIHGISLKSRNRLKYRPATCVPADTAPDSPTESNTPPLCP